MGTVGTLVSLADHHGVSFDALGLTLAIGFLAAAASFLRATAVLLHEIRIWWERPFKQKNALSGRPPRPRDRPYGP
jgi:hypothetical protein